MEGVHEKDCQVLRWKRKSTSAAGSSALFDILLIRGAAINRFYY